MTSTEDYLMAAAFVLIGGFTFFLGFIKMRKYRLIRDIPRSKIKSMAMGVIEIHGHVEADKLIKSPFSQTECVYYKFEIKEYRQSSSSKKSGSTRKWEVVGSGDRSVPFIAKDETGTALVEPDKAEFVVTHKKVFYQKGQGFLASLKSIPRIVKALKTFNPNDTTSLLLEGDPLQPMEERKGLQVTNVGDRKYYEYYIEPGDGLFVLGTAANSPDTPGNIVIKRGKNEKTFIISDKSEKAVLKNIKKTMLMCLIIGGIFLVTGVLLLFMAMGIVSGG
ncbi:MAG: E3 ubiquitin ligase family protein [candidate division Zixibacteria bacterium]|nr:E3 ubiquitin ligase family protein [candidate division Zixibacteria bacterium]